MVSLKPRPAIFMRRQVMNVGHSFFAPSLDNSSISGARFLSIAQLPLIRCHECGASALEGKPYGILEAFFITLSEYYHQRTPRRRFSHNNNRQPSDIVDNGPKKSGLANLGARYDLLALNPLTLLFGDSVRHRSPKAISEDDNYRRPYPLSRDLTSRHTNGGNHVHHARPPDLASRLDPYGSSLPQNLRNSTKPSPQSRKKLSIPTSQPHRTSKSAHTGAFSSVQSPDLSTVKRQKDFHPSSSPSQFPPITQPPSVPPKNLKKKNNARRNRGFSRRNPWELHYHYLSSLLPPTITISDRNDPTLHTLFLQSLRSHPYIPHCRRSQNRRLAFISAQRAHLARENHIKKVLWARERLRRRRLYKLAYLKFKRERIELLERLGKLKMAYRRGWSPFREWKAWRRIRLMVRETEGRKRFWRRRGKGSLVLDRIQRMAERRIFRRGRMRGGSILSPWREVRSD